MNNVSKRAINPSAHIAILKTYCIKIRMNATTRECGSVPCSRK